MDTSLSALDLNLLVTLDALLQERSVSRAARRLGLSPSATSHALGRLRDLLGDPLLVREGRGMVPTPRGRALTDPTHQVIRAASRLLTLPRSQEAGLAPRWLTVEMPSVLVPVLGATLHRELTQTAPHIGLDLTLPGATPSPSVSVGTAPRRGNLRPKLLYRDALVAVRAMRQPPVVSRTVDEFAALPHVVALTDALRTEDLVDRRMASHGATRKVAHRVQSLLDAAHLAATTELIAILPSQVATALSTTLRLRAYELPFQGVGLPIHAWWNEAAAQDLEHALLVAALSRSTARQGLY